AGGDRCRQKGTDVLAGPRQVMLGGLRLGYFVRGAALMPELVLSHPEDAADGQDGGTADSSPIDEGAVGGLQVRHDRIAPGGLDPAVRTRSLGVVEHHLTG